MVSRLPNQYYCTHFSGIWGLTSRHFHYCAICNARKHVSWLCASLTRYSGTPEAADRYNSQNTNLTFTSQLRIPLKVIPLWHRHSQLAMSQQLAQSQSPEIAQQRQQLWRMTVELNSARLPQLSEQTSAVNMAASAASQTITSMNDRLVSECIRRYADTIVAANILQRGMFKRQSCLHDPSRLWRAVLPRAAVVHSSMAMWRPL